MAVQNGDTSHSLSVGPVTLSIGDSYTFENELKTTVNAVNFHPTLLYSVSSGGANGESQMRLLQPGSKKMLMVARISLENVGTSEATFTTQQPNGTSGSNAASLLIRPGNWYDRLDNAPLSALEEVEGQPLNQATLSAGQQQSGWLLAQVPRFAATDTISLNYQRDATNTRPEATWKLAPNQGSKRALPKFSLQNFQMPSPRPITNGAKYTVAVTNTGNASGTFRGLVTVGGSGSTNQQTVKAISKRISPGVTKTIQGTHPRQFVNLKTYQLEPFGQVATVKTTLAERRFGQSYPTPFQQELTVGQPVTSDQIVYKGNHEFAPDRGKQFVSVPVTVNLTGQDASIPSYRYYTLQAAGATYEPELVTPQYNIQQQPVSGRKYRRLNLNSGGQGTGVLVFQVPRRVSTNQLSIQMKYDEGNSQPYGAIWSNSTSASTTAGTGMPSTTTGR